MPCYEWKSIIMENSANDISDLETEGQKFKSKNNKIGFSKPAVVSVVVLLAFAVALFLVFCFQLSIFRISGSPMNSILKENDIVVSVNQSNIKAGDMVAFYSDNLLHIQRCVAGPGDMVDIDDNGNVYVNSEFFCRSYVDEKALSDSDILLPHKVEGGHFFVVGDNRSVTQGNRISSFSCLAENELKGKIVFRIWPLDRIGKP